MAMQEAGVAGTVEVTPKGITYKNIQSIKAELIEALGKDWVSTDKAVLTGYGRDFSTTVGQIPNIAVLPASTEDVQKVMRLAKKYGMPVVPFTTGLNMGGLTLPRRGGILLDLKRMDKILNIDEETMTMTFQPHVRNAVARAAAIKRFATPDLHLRIALPLALGSIAAFSNYVARGGSGIMGKVGNQSDLIVNMTWVLPDGEILKLGPSAVPGVGNVPVQWGPGPDLSGMFINADGGFGVCTEMTVKLFAEWPLEKLYVFDAEESENTLETACEMVIKTSQEDITDYIYKSSFCQLATMIGIGNVQELADSLPENPVLVIVTGLDEEELEIRGKIVLKLAEEVGMYPIDVNAFGSVAGMFQDPKLWKTFGPKNIGAVVRHKGSFQFTACYMKLDKIPTIAKDYYKLRNKYWKPSDPEVTEKMSMAGTAIQGPLPFCRVSTLEYDYWWDQGNVEDMKRATLMLRKANELNLKHGGMLWRNMNGMGEIHLPMHGKYYELLKKTKRMIDPDNIMHPDIDPLTDDYV